VSDDEPTQIPVDAPAPEEGEPVDVVSPEPQGEATSARAYTAPDYASSASDSGGVAEERPELVVAGAFAGAFILAKLLQRIGGSR
jgi:hypothetical protein